MDWALKLLCEFVLWGPILQQGHDDSKSVNRKCATAERQMLFTGDVHLSGDRNSGTDYDACTHALCPVLRSLQQSWTLHVAPIQIRAYLPKSTRISQTAFGVVLPSVQSSETLLLTLCSFFEAVATRLKEHGKIIMFGITFTLINERNRSGCVSTAGALTPI